MSSPPPPRNPWRAPVPPRPQLVRRRRPLRQREVLPPGPPPPRSREWPRRHRRGPLLSPKVAPRPPPVRRRGWGPGWRRRRSTSSPTRRPTTGSWRRSWPRAPTGGWPRAGLRPRRSGPPGGRPRRGAVDPPGVVLHRPGPGRDGRGAAPGDLEERRPCRPVPGGDAGVRRCRLPPHGGGVRGLGSGPDLRGRHRGAAVVRADAHSGPHRSGGPGQPAAGVRRDRRAGGPGRAGDPGVGYVPGRRDRAGNLDNGRGRREPVPNLHPPVRGRLLSPPGRADWRDRPGPPGGGMIRLAFPLLFAAVLFAIGVYGGVGPPDSRLVLLSIELMLNAVNVNLVAFNQFLTDGTFAGQIFTLFVITVAAAEVGIGLAIVILIYRNRETINVDEVNLLKW